jgi:hypothetical protein
MGSTLVTQKENTKVNSSEEGHGRALPSSDILLPMAFLGTGSDRYI